jgi:hypothetical protein
LGESPELEVQEGYLSLEEDKKSEEEDTGKVLSYSFRRLGGTISSKDTENFDQGKKQPYMTMNSLGTP